MYQYNYFKSAFSFLWIILGFTTWKKQSHLQIFLRPSFSIWSLSETLIQLHPKLLKNSIALQEGLETHLSIKVYFLAQTGKLFLKGTDGKHFKLVDYVVSETTIQLYCCRTPAAIDNMQTNGHGYVLLKLFMKTHGHPMNCCFPTCATTIGSSIFLMPYEGCLSKKWFCWERLEFVSFIFKPSKSWLFYVF